MKKRKHIIDVDKLSTIFGDKYIDRGDNFCEIKAQNGSKILITDKESNKLEIIDLHKSYLSMENITDVYYFKHNKVFVAESVSEENIVEIAIFKDGRYDLRARKLNDIENFPMYSTIYATRNKNEQWIEEVSQNPMLEPIIKTAMSGDGLSLRRELISLLKNIIINYPSKPIEDDTDASRDLELLEVIFFNFDDLIGVKHERLDVNRNSQLYKLLTDVGEMHLIRNAVFDYLTWYKEESYNQKDLLEAIKDYESGKKSVVFSHPPQKHKVEFNLTVEKLANKIVAISCNERTYDAAKKEYSMIIEPLYGAKPEVKEKRFRLSFIDCIYVSEHGKILEDDMHRVSWEDFIYWGADFDNSTELGKELEDKRTELQNTVGSKDIIMYYFGGMGSMDIIIFCKETKVIIE